MKKTKLIIALLFITFTGISAKYYIDNRSHQNRLALYKQLIPFSEASKATSFDDKADAIRTFINKKTDHKIDEEFRAMEGNEEKIVQTTLSYLKGEKQTPPHLECASRADMMEAMLMAEGYRVRSVSVYAWDKEAQILRAHRFLETQNPKTGNWQIQDPDLDLFWTINETGRRASMEDLIKLKSPKMATPCNSQGQCGWEIKSREGFDAARMHKYMALASIKDHQIGKRPLLVNTSRFDLNEQLPIKGKEQTYCEYIPKNCREDIRKF